MCLVYNPDWSVLVRIYYVTCLNLLFSNRRVQIYIYKRTDVRTDVEHAGDVLDRGMLGTVCPPTRVHDMGYRERSAESRQSVPGC